jgi:hypothetical protein
MKTSPNTNRVTHQVEAALHSLDGITRAGANPFLFTRLQAHLQARLSPWEKAAHFLARPAFATLLVAFAISINLWVVARQQPAQKMSKLSLPHQEPEHDFAAEFSTVNYALAEPAKTVK